MGCVYPHLVFYDSWSRDKDYGQQYLLPDQTDGMHVQLTRQNANHTFSSTLLQPKYLLTSLASNDLAIGLLVTPFGFLPAVYGCWPYGEVVCQIQVSIQIEHIETLIRTQRQHIRDENEKSARTHQETEDRKRKTEDVQDCYVQRCPILGQTPDPKDPLRSSDSQIPIAALFQGWSATGQMRDTDQTLSPLMAAGPKLRSYFMTLAKIHRYP
ncbi:hypothetical protein WN48_04164 [Eufriesea mexicana]|nr:hypothetical protein WN48_04164 [Eufriesea mexicana]